MDEIKPQIGGVNCHIMGIIQDVIEKCNYEGHIDCNNINTIFG